MLSPLEDKAKVFIVEKTVSLNNKKNSEAKDFSVPERPPMNWSFGFLWTLVCQNAPPEFHAVVVVHWKTSWLPGR